MQIGTKYIWENFYFDIIVFTQHTWVLMKVSFVFFCFLQKKSSGVFIKTNIFALVIRLQKTSSRCLEQIQHSSWLYIFKTSSRRFQDVFKTSSRRAKMSFRHPQKVLLRRLQDIFKTSSRGLTKASLRHLQDVLQRCLQDFFNTYHQVKLFLLTCFQDVFETYSKHSWHLLERRLSTEGFF